MTIRIDKLPSHPWTLVLLLTVLAVPTSLSSQEIIVPLQFSFSDPGARSMGFGGAFVALADDATAAFSNPAGLVQLTKPEVSIEGRRWSYSTPFTEGGRIEGLPSGFGIDTTTGLRTATSDDVVTGLSFLAVAYPKGRWSLALYRHQLAKFEFFGETQGLFGGGTTCCQIRFEDQRVSTELDFVSYGVSGAYRISDRFAVGFGFVYQDSSITTLATLFLPDDDSLESIFGPNSYFPERSLASQRSLIDDTDWTGTVGFLWNLSESWNIGGVYRQGPEATVSTVVTAGEASDLGVPPGGVIHQEPPIPAEFPSIVGLGLAYRETNGHLTVSFQWDHIEYSTIVESIGADDVTVDDADELHLGGEYVFLKSTPIIAVRVGAWLDPDHQVRTTIDNPLHRALRPRGDDEMHYAAGLGVAFKRFQVDLGVDFADRVDTLSLSAIYNF